MKKILFICLFLYSCVDILPDAERLYFKIIELPDIRVEWFHYSFISNTSPDFIVAYYEETIDTICVAHNISDFEITTNEIKVSSYGTLEKYNEPVSLPNFVSNYKVTSDTTFTLESQPFRNFFRKAKK
ncbi:MAG: hypothetical protein ACJA1N_001137 [Saprospiraceae bacterium]|jgi:hypothetical protein